MTINKNNIGSQLDKILRPMGITRNLRSYHLICACIVRIFEQEDRLGAVQKEIYMPIAEADRCDWTGIQSAIRRAAQTAWHNCHDTVRRSRVTQRRDGQLPIPNNRFRLSASTVSCCYKQSFRSRLLRLRI